jgi:hypothetical protein
MGPIDAKIFADAFEVNSALRYLDLVGMIYFVIDVILFQFRAQSCDISLLLLFSVSFVFSLEGNQIGPAGTYFLAEAFKVNSTLEILMLNSMLRHCFYTSLNFKMFALISSN